MKNGKWKMENLLFSFTCLTLSNKEKRTGRNACPTALRFVQLSSGEHAVDLVGSREGRHAGPDDRLLSLHGLRECLVCPF
jgi:hypothetical protein